MLSRAGRSLTVLVLCWGLVCQPLQATVSIKRGAEIFCAKYLDFLSRSEELLADPGEAKRFFQDHGKGVISRRRYKALESDLLSATPGKTLVFRGFDTISRLYFKAVPEVFTNADHNEHYQARGDTEQATVLIGAGLALWAWAFVVWWNNGKLKIGATQLHGTLVGLGIIAAAKYVTRYYYGESFAHFNSELTKTLVNDLAEGTESVLGFGYDRLRQSRMTFEVLYAFSNGEPTVMVHVFEKR
ncbi:hypothetical protein K2X33_07460 [bacterium]|nr:hypothetical protein [bacterium]